MAWTRETVLEANPSALKDRRFQINGFEVFVTGQAALLNHKEGETQTQAENVATWRSLRGVY